MTHRSMHDTDKSIEQQIEIGYCNLTQAAKENKKK